MSHKQKVMKEYRLAKGKSNKVHVQVKLLFGWVTIKTFKEEDEKLAFELFDMLSEDLYNIKDYQTAHDNIQHIYEDFEGYDI